MEVKLAIFQKERSMCSIDIINLGILESNMLAEVGDKALCKINAKYSQPR